MSEAMQLGPAIMLLREQLEDGTFEDAPDQAAAVRAVLDGLNSLSDQLRTYEGELGLLQPGTCNGCKADVHWIMMAKSGKLMPCNKRTEMIVTSGGTIQKGWISHFATCPKAAGHRKP